MPHNPRLPRVRYILGELVGHVTSTAQIKTVRPNLRRTPGRRAPSPAAARRSRPPPLGDRGRVRVRVRPQAIVRIPRWHKVNKLDIDVRRNSKIWAHDEFELCAVGDTVRIEQSRALSKRKAHVVTEILKKEDGTTPPKPFPKW
jgi:ribosomal protein S17